MRSFLIVAALLGIPFSALAQQAPPTVETAQTPSAVQVSGAREMARILLLDSGVVGVAVESAFAERGPQLRQQLLGSEMYANLRPSAQRALAIWIDGIPGMVREEVAAAMPGIAEDFAQHIAPLFSDSEITEIVAFLNEPVTRAAFLRTVVAGVRSAATDGRAGLPDLSPEENLAFATFAITPAGRALDEKGDQLGQHLRQAMTTGSQALMPRIQQRMMRDMCAALGDECPSHLRRAIAPA